MKGSFDMSFSRKTDQNSEIDQTNPLLRAKEWSNPQQTIHRSTRRPRLPLNPLLSHQCHVPVYKISNLGMRVAAHVTGLAGCNLVGVCFVVFPISPPSFSFVAPLLPTFLEVMSFWWFFPPFSGPTTHQPNQSADGSAVGPQVP